MEQVRHIRKRAGYSQRELASLSGVDAITISRIETGASDPHPATLRKLARALGVPVAEFFAEEVVPPKAPAPLWPDTPKNMSVRQRRTLFGFWTARFEREVHTLRGLVEDIPDQETAGIIALAAQKILDVLEEQDVLDELRSIVSVLKVGGEDLHPEDVEFHRMVSGLVGVIRKVNEVTSEHYVPIVNLDRYRDLSA